MVNYNGTLLEDKNFISSENRGYKFGDALFETLKVVNGKILFWEDHYFRLMASMRILRMEIPMQFTMEFLEAEILKTIEANSLINHTARVRFNVDRGEGGKYLPNSKATSYNIIAENLTSSIYSLPNTTDYIIDLYKDYFVTPGLLSTLKTNNKVINVLGSIYAKENNLNNCLLLNTNKNIVEALNGNLFLVKDAVIKTPPLTDGCLNGIMRKQVINAIKDIEGLEFQEISISPFELQKADELFTTNVILGLQPISKFRKKHYKAVVSKLILQKVNTKLRLS
ncbi:aminotransferase class IV [Ichthyenterobacterium magnum]|uniref:branched-chain-amino-acid transaminase n=1 Tax=Ichthyenterobacterium magnum TaxID=1230530 RepID=A0A420DL81_9FLAO|nr:aminotransferase class IV [Ichthyenterobacterium magnum]RKE94937.1 branched-chain amino acid aminotransferase [Ichthyenterobacterium magnum]